MWRHRDRHVGIGTKCEDLCMMCLCPPESIHMEEALNNELGKAAEAIDVSPPLSVAT